MLRLSCPCRCLRSFQIPSSVRRYASVPNPHNQAIVDMLRKHREEENASPNKNGYKVRAFDNAIKLLNKLDHPLRSAGEAITLKGVGSGIARRISEFLAQTDDPTDLSDEKRKDSMRRLLKADLESIPGIGQVMAQKLIDAGLTNFADLRTEKFSDMLKPHQKIGLQYLEHLRKPVSREDAEIVAECVRDNISPKYEVILAGSYRRGAASSSDIDIILLHPKHVHVPVPNVDPPECSLNQRKIKRVIRAEYVKGADKTSLLHGEVVPKLEGRGLLAAPLTQGARKWQGIVRIPEKDERGAWRSWRERLQRITNGQGTFARLDLNLVPTKSRGAAMIALTGDIELNRHLRLKASKLGMHLNEFGLWRWVSNGSVDEEAEEAEADTEDQADETSDREPQRGFWQLVRATTEEEIFEELGVDFVEPQRRNFTFITKRATVARARKKSAIS